MVEIALRGFILRGWSRSTLSSSLWGVNDPSGDGSRSRCSVSVLGGVGIAWPPCQYTVRRREKIARAGSVINSEAEEGIVRPRKWDRAK